MSIRYTRKQWADLQDQEKQIRLAKKQQPKPKSNTTRLVREVAKNRTRFRNKVQMLEYMEAHSIPFSNYEYSTDPKVVEAYERRKGLKNAQKQ